MQCIFVKEKVEGSMGRVREGRKQRWKEGSEGVREGGKKKGKEGGKEERQILITGNEALQLLDIP